MCVCVCVCARSDVPDSFATPLTIVPQTPLSMDLFQLEYWSGLPIPSLGIFSTPGSNPHFLCLFHWQVGSLSLSHRESPLVELAQVKN